MPLLLPKDTTKIDDVLDMLRNALERIPVRHLSPVDSMVDSKEQYVLARLASGRYSIKPNITRQGLLFRGDSRKQTPFYSRFGQEQIIGHGGDVRKKIIPINVKRSDFEIAIESFPLYQMLKRGVVLPNGKKLVMEIPFGLAYAYDHPTPFIGLTSNLDIAAFYAVTEYNARTRKYKPVTEGQGVLYAFELRFPFSMTIGLTTLGRLVFPRTINQKTFLLNISPEMDFNKGAVVTGFVFNHDAAMSQRIFDRFKGGELLAPSDDFLLKKLQSFPEGMVSKKAVLRNLAENKGDKARDIIMTLHEADVRIADGFDPTFTKDELSCVYKDIAGYWQNMIKDVYVDGRHGEEIKKYLMELPWNPDYSVYFDLNKYFDAR